MILLRELVRLALDAYLSSFGGQKMAAARGVLRALSSRAIERVVAELQRSERGWELLQRKPSLHDALAERGPTLDEGTLGREAWRWRRTFGLGDAPGYAMTPEGDTDRRWVIRRWGVVHDLWHVLTGYGPDAAGEALMAAWTTGAFRDRGNALFAIAALFASVPGVSRVRWVLEMFRAWRAGRAAGIELAEHAYEELLALDVRDVRNQLRLADPLAVHPQGIPVGPFWGAHA